MERKMIEIASDANMDLLKDLPHVLPRLIDLLMGEWEPTQWQQEELLAHLAECLYCQIALRICIEQELNYDRSMKLSEDLGRLLLSQLTEIIHATTIRDDIGTYIEIADAGSIEEANTRFPLLAEHLRVCNACQRDVHGTLDLLQRAKHAGFIGPQDVSTSE